MNPLHYIRWRFAWWRWFLQVRVRWGDPMYGKGESLRANLDHILERWLAEEPRREDYT